MYLSIKSLCIGRSCCWASDIAIGILGAFAGDWLVPHLGVHLSAGTTGTIIDATIGATVLLLITKLGRGGPCEV
jgi:uncharacterized membrane protein YeaQ/YmgE (transglycosylase-associated protein family)